MNYDELAPQRRLTGKELEAAKKSVRWLDPEVCRDRIDVARVPAGEPVPLWVWHTKDKPRKQVVASVDSRAKALLSSQESRRQNKARAA